MKTVTSVATKSEAVMDLNGDMHSLAQGPNGLPSMYMPIKALNTFSRDWKIQARVASKSEKRMTRNGGSLLKIELVDMYGTQIEGTFFNEAAD